ncbi:MAG: hypothetical protein IJT46_06245 [Bacteroidaceae bacterium]|nr:hypothetical protein [Bacteroidaceae bacterium]
MDAIGGYFELADYEEGKGFLHEYGILLNTGRNALEYILRCIGEVKGIYLPYYTCEVVLEPLKKLHIPYSFYHINANFELVEYLQPKNGEYIIANNYFGIKDAYIQKLAEKYGTQLIVDCAQAFFAKPIPGIKTFYSTRKFVGVADGGVAYGVDGKYSLLYDEDDSTLHNSHLRIRKEQGAEAGFKEYQLNETKLDNLPIRLMCRNTRDILWHIDYDKVVAKRRANYTYLHDALKDKNLLQLPDMGSFACPMVYPFMMRRNRDLRTELIAHKVFVARYWPNVHQLDHYELEYQLASRVIPIPCDQAVWRRRNK